MLESAAETVRAETAAQARVRQDLADFTVELRTALAADIDSVDAGDIRKYLSFFVQDTWKAWTEAEGERMAAELERLAEQVIQVANENVRDVANGVVNDLGPSQTKVDIKVDTLKYDASVFALGALGTTVFLFVNTLVGGVLALAAPVLAMVLRGRVATEVKAEAKEHGPLGDRPRRDPDRSQAGRDHRRLRRPPAGVRVAGGRRPDARHRRRAALRRRAGRGRADRLGRQGADPGARLPPRR